MRGESVSIDPAAQIGEGCHIGHNAVVLAGARIGAGCDLGHNVVVHAGTVLGEGVVVGDNAVLGKQPRPSPTSTVKIRDSLPGLVLADGCSIGAGAVVYAGTTVGRQTMIADQAFVRERCTIGDYVKIQTGAYVTAYMTIEDHVFLAPGVYTTNDNFMGRTEERFKFRKGPTIRYGARVGANTTLLPGIEIGREAFVAAGSVVTRDVAPATLVMGVPARPVRPVPEREWAENQ
jgi:acetyltransferase-like isoleucine patch superfamily enzyme